MIKKIKLFWKWLNTPFKIIFFIWFVYSLSALEQINFFQWLAVWIVGFSIFVLLPNFLIYIRGKNKIKKYELTEKTTISISEIQRKYNIGFSYAKNIMDALFLNGYIGEENDYKPRQLLCEENKVFQFIEENFNKCRPVEYDEYYGKGSNGITYDVQPKEHIKGFDSMDGHEFEYFCADLLKKNGFKNVEVTKGSGDQGIDIVAEKDGIKYAIQCKCYSSDINNKAVQEAFAGKTFYNCHVAVVLTNRYFTQSAKELAEKNNVLLWDRNYLENLISNAKGNAD